MRHLTYSIEDRVATLVLDNPPQNRIDEQMTNELDDALDGITRSGARAVLLREGPDFSYVKTNLPLAVDAVEAGRPRPAFDFLGR